jgi:hypothetical protein
MISGIDSSIPLMFWCVVRVNTVGSGKEVIEIELEPSDEHDVISKQRRQIQEKFL